MKFSDRITELRQTRNLSQEQVAKSCGIATRTYQRYEYGERDMPCSVLDSLADFFDVSTDYLLGRTDNPEVNR